MRNRNNCLRSGSLRSRVPAIHRLKWSKYNQDNFGSSAVSTAEAWKLADVSCHGAAVSVAEVASGNEEDEEADLEGAALLRPEERRQDPTAVAVQLTHDAKLRQLHAQLE